MILLDDTNHSSNLKKLSLPRIQKIECRSMLSRELRATVDAPLSVLGPDGGEFPENAVSFFARPLVLAQPGAPGNLQPVGMHSSELVSSRVGRPENEPARPPTAF